MGRTYEESTPLSIRMRRWWTLARASMWFRPTLGAVLATVTAFSVVLLNGVVSRPEAIPDIDQRTLDDLLTVIASSMLAVSTFSLSIMVAAFASTSTTATPRATELIMRDDSTRTAIASFISAFIFAIIAKVALGLGYYDSVSRFIMFIATALVLLYLVVTLIRWVKTMSTLGRIGNALAKAEQAASIAVRAHRRSPLLGADPAPEQPPAGARVTAGTVGYVAEIDMAGLNRIADRRRWRIHVRVRPGSLVTPSTVLAIIEGDGDGPGPTRSAFTISSERQFHQDPRHGLMVISEIGQRALSAAVNDPGTAIRAINAATRIIVDTEVDRSAMRELNHLTMVSLDPADLVRAAYAAIARDGAGIVEVGVTIQAALGAVAVHRPGALADAAAEEAEHALERAMRALELEAEQEAVMAAHAQWHRDATDASGIEPMLR